MRASVLVMIFICFANPFTLPIKVGFFPTPVEVINMEN